MEQQPHSLEKELELRYGAAFAREICDRLAGMREREQKANEIREMEKVLARGRARVREVLRAFRTWKIEYRLANLGTSRRHLAAEGEILRRTLMDFIAVYRAISKDYHMAQRVTPGRPLRAESPSGRAAAA